MAVEDPRIRAPGGLQLGPKLFLFGGVATVVVVALVSHVASAHRGAASSQARSQCWSLTWIGSLLETASLRGAGIRPHRTSPR
jgi:hypothetical protein